jgi:PAS domain S-box-containing protein
VQRRRAHRLLSQVIEALPVGLIVTTTEPKIVYANPEVSALTGYSRDELIGANPSVLSAGQTDPAVYVEMWSAITAGKTYTRVLVDQKKSGEVYWVHLTIFPLRDSRGATSHYVAIHRDVTSERRVATSGAERRRVLLKDVQPGMVVVSDVLSASGVRLLPAGHAADESLLRRLQRCHERGGVREPILVVIPAHVDRDAAPAGSEE